MTEKKLRKVIGITMIIGAFMRIFEHPQGALIFTVAFGAYLGMKLYKLLEFRIRYWTKLHFFQLTLILVAFAALFFKYYDYPYSGAVLIISLLAEALVSVKIKLNSMFGDSNVNAFLRMIRNFLLATRSGKYQQADEKINKTIHI